MKRLSVFLLLIIFFTGSFSHICAADITPFSSENWHTLPHPKVAEFALSITGEAYGTLIDGRVFTQTNVPNELGIRVQRFSIDSHYHFIIEGIPVYSLEALSTQLAYEYNRKAT